MLAADVTDLSEGVNAVVAATVNAAAEGADVAGEGVVNATCDAAMGALVTGVAWTSLFGFSGALKFGAVMVCWVISLEAGWCPLRGLLLDLVAPMEVLTVVFAPSPASTAADWEWAVVRELSVVDEDVPDAAPVEEFCADVPSRVVDVLGFLDPELVDERSDLVSNLIFSVGV